MGISMYRVGLSYGGALTDSSCSSAVAMPRPSAGGACDVSGGPSPVRKLRIASEVDLLFSDVELLQTTWKPLHGEVLPREEDRLGDAILRTVHLFLAADPDQIRCKTSKILRQLKVFDETHWLFESPHDKCEYIMCHHT